MSKHIVKYGDWNCKVLINTYQANNATAITLEDADDGQPVATATVNLDHTLYIPEGFAFLNEPDHPGITKILQDARIVGPTIMMGSSGFNISKYPLVEILIQKE